MFIGLRNKRHSRSLRGPGVGDVQCGGSLCPASIASMMVFVRKRTRACPSIVGRVTGLTSDQLWNRLIK